VEHIRDIQYTLETRLASAMNAERLLTYIKEVKEQGQYNLWVTILEDSLGIKLQKSITTPLCQGMIINAGSVKI